MLTRRRLTDEKLPGKRPARETASAARPTTVHVGRRQTPTVHVGTRRVVVGRREPPPVLIGRRETPPVLVGRRQPTPVLIGRREPPAVHVGRREPTPVHTAMRRPPVPVALPDPRGVFRPELYNPAPGPLFLNGPAAAARRTYEQFVGPSRRRPNPARADAAEPGFFRGMWSRLREEGRRMGEHDQADYAAGIPVIGPLAQLAGAAIPGDDVFDQGRRAINRGLHNTGTAVATIGAQALPNWAGGERAREAMERELQNTAAAFPDGRRTVEHSGVVASKDARTAPYVSTPVELGINPRTGLPYTPEQVAREQEFRDDFGQFRRAVGVHWRAAQEDPSGALSWAYERTLESVPQMIVAGVLTRLGFPLTAYASVALPTIGGVVLEDSVDPETGEMRDLPLGEFIEDVGKGAVSAAIDQVPIADEVGRVAGALRRTGRLAPEAVNAAEASAGLAHRLARTTGATVANTFEEGGTEWLQSVIEGNSPDQQAQSLFLGGVAGLGARAPSLVAALPRPSPTGTAPALTAGADGVVAPVAFDPEQARPFRADVVPTAPAAAPAATAGRTADPYHMERADEGLVEALVRQEPPAARPAVPATGAQGPTAATPTQAQSLPAAIPQAAPTQTLPVQASDPGSGVAPPQAPPDPVESRRSARERMDAMLTAFGGDVRTALAAYHWGPENVGALLARTSERLGRPAAFEDVYGLLPAATRGHGRTVVADYRRAAETGAAAATGAPGRGPEAPGLPAGYPDGTPAGGPPAAVRPGAGPLREGPTDPAERVRLLLERAGLLGPGAGADRAPGVAGPGMAGPGAAPAGRGGGGTRGAGPVDPRYPNGRGPVGPVGRRGADGRAAADPTDPVERVRLLIARARALASGGPGVNPGAGRPGAAPAGRGAGGARGASRATNDVAATFGPGVEFSGGPGVYPGPSNPGTSGPGTSGPGASGPGASGPGAARLGDRNVFVTPADYDAAVRTLNRSLTLAAANPFADPEIWRSAVVLAAYALETGGRAFEAWAARMVEELGEAIRPHLARLYHHARAALEGVPVARRTPSWPPGFPRVIQQTTVAWLKRHPDYRAAKEDGDEAAAVRLVFDLFQGEVQQAKARALAARYPSALVVPIRKEGGKNALPGAYATYLTRITRLKLEGRIVQVGSAGRTGKNMRERFARRPAFAGPVEPGRTYILVDDVVAAGGTAADLRAYIEERGGRVVAVSALAVSLYGHQIAILPQTLQALHEKFGQRPLEAFLDEYGLYGGNAGALTEREARALLLHPSLDVPLFDPPAGG